MCSMAKGSLFLKYRVYLLLSEISNSFVLKIKLHDCLNHYQVTVVEKRKTEEKWSHSKVFFKAPTIYYTQLYAHFQAQVSCTTVSLNVDMGLCFVYFPPFI